jgi:hypothetical protein
MDSRTGDLYPTVEAAKAAGVPDEFLVELRGEPDAVGEISKAVKEARRAAAKRAKASRKRNR